MKVKYIILIILAVLALVIIVQNSEVVTYKILFWEISISRIILVPVFMLVGFVIGLFFPKGGKKRS